MLYLGVITLNWRWDQGRLQYFQFDNLKAIAHSLVLFDNVQISTCEENFRQQLVKNVELSFSPDTADYPIRRNYKRVFECVFLATFVNGRLQCTDVCREMAKTDSRLAYVDEYFSYYIPRFRYPFPAFKDYAETTHRVYPFCAVLKYLTARLEYNLDPRISVDDTLNILMANDCTGYETRDYFLNLTPKVSNIASERQVREMLIFMSQMSIFKMKGNYLYLDVVWSKDMNEFLTKISTPFGGVSWLDQEKEFFSQTQIDSNSNIPTIVNNDLYSSDVEFIEGKRTRVEHIKIERSPLLRKYYIQQYPKPTCRMCEMDMSQRYPWTDYLLEIHHLLPLSSPLHTLLNGTTSLEDIVGLCPTCHRSLHNYYKKWLDEHKCDDFTSKEEVIRVYNEARGKIII